MFHFILSLIHMFKHASTWVVSHRHCILLAGQTCASHNWSPVGATHFLWNKKGQAHFTHNAINQHEFDYDLKTMDPLMENEYWLLSLIFHKMTKSTYSNACTIHILNFYKMSKRILENVLLPVLTMPVLLHRSI